MTNAPRRVLEALILLLAAAMACAFPSLPALPDNLSATPTTQPSAEIVDTDSPTPPPTLTPSPTETASFTPTPLLGVAPTTAPPTLGPRTCRNDAQFVVDVTVPDGTEFDAGRMFTKTWRVRNTGTCAWTGEYSLVFVGGEQMGGPDAVPIVGEVPPGSLYNLSVELIAPGAPGIYSGQWRLYDVRSGPFGTNDAPLTVVIVVR